MIFVLLCSELISFSLFLLLCMSTMLVNKVDHNVINTLKTRYRPIYNGCFAQWNDDYQ